MARRTVPFFLDSISPFVWRALSGSVDFAERHGIVWEPRPVVYAKLLEAHGLLGPAETAAKRRHTFHDAVRSARPQGVRRRGLPEPGP